MFALADCNNFFVSCERVFRPDLEGRPVIVLSRNDGCAIARSNEAKALGIKMGDPLFKIKELVARHNVTVFSSNMELYADFSRRVRSILRQSAPQIEVYSIDEAFLDLRGLDNMDFDMFAKSLSARCRRETGVPVSVGVAPTKTLAKIAAELCKHYPKLRGGCYMYRKEDVEKVLRKCAIEDVWGIGRRSAPRLRAIGVNTAYDFTRLSCEWVQRKMGATGLRTWHELHGTPSIGFEHSVVAKQSICNSRSFSSEIYDFRELREQSSLCSQLTVFIATNRFSTAVPQQFGHITIPFAEPTDSALRIARSACEALEEIFVAGTGYKKAGVTASGITPREGNPHSMFNAEENERHHRLMQAIDHINRLSSMGHGITIASEHGTEIKANSNYRSPRYTTSWDELPKVR